MKIHQVSKNDSNRTSRQIGRGGKRGYTSGRGSKGQKARAGHRIRPALRDIIKKFPKQRGYRFKARIKPEVVNLSIIDKTFEANEIIEPSKLIKKNLIRRQGGKIPAVKILAYGDLSKPLIFSNCAVSVIAEEKIIKAGGKIKA